MTWAQAAGGGEGVGQILTASLWMAGILLVGAILLTILKRIQSRREAAQPSSAQEQLAQFRAAHEKGEISTDEYQRLRAMLTGQIKEQPVIPPPAPKARAEEKPAGEKPAEEAKPDTPGAA
jgi:hypothetical protein